MFTIYGTDMAQISPQWSLGFKVTAPIGQNGAVYLEISQFNGVPAPLPAAGAASVFAVSRRLRGRCRGIEVRCSGRPSPPPASAYLTRTLNLPGDALGGLPVSFSYGPQSPGKGAKAGVQAAV